MGWKRRKRTENSSSCANVLHRTLNLVISRRHLGDDGKEMYQNVKRTCRACRAIVFVASSLPSASSFRKLPVVLLTTAKKWTEVKNARATCAAILFALNISGVYK